MYSVVICKLFFIAAALDYLLHHPLPPVDKVKFEEESGVGIVITPDQVEAAVRLST